MLSCTKSPTCLPSFVNEPSVASGGEERERRGQTELCETIDQPFWLWLRLLSEGFSIWAPVRDACLSDSIASRSGSKRDVSRIVQQADGLLILCSM